MPWRTFGNSAIVEAFQRNVAAGTLPHAILLTGAPQVGKHTLAVDIACALLCESGADLLGEREAPCYACRACRLVLEGRHPDFEVLEPGGVCDIAEHRGHQNARDLRICQLRRLERVIANHPFEASYRVVILDPADAMTNEAANALLKSLEEPPPHTVMVLVSSAPEQLPDTIRSRCQRFDLKPLSTPELAAHLEARGAQREEAVRLARLAGGRPGRAIQLQDRPELLDAAVRLKENSRVLASASVGDRLAYSASLADRWSGARADIQNELRLWEEFWEAVLFASWGSPESAVDPDDSGIAQATARGMAPEEVAAFLARLRETRYLLERNISPRLALDVLVLSMPTAGPA